MMGATGEPSGYYLMDSNRLAVQSELPAPLENVRAKVWETSLRLLGTRYYRAKAAGVRMRPTKTLRNGKRLCKIGLLM